MANYVSLNNDKEAVSPYISVAQFISDLKVVEDLYFNQLDDKDLKKTCTRIRVHYYGHMQKGFIDTFKGIVFNHTIPLADYAYLTRKLRLIHFITLGKEKVYERLTSQAHENVDKDKAGDNNSPYLVHNGNYIDLGQVLYGFESLVYQMDVGDYSEYDSYKEPNPNRNPRTYGRSYNSIPVRRINDLAGWVANVATPVAEMIQHEFNGKSKYGNKVPSAKIDTYYKISAPDADLFGNVDAIGIYYAYKKLEHHGTKLRLSDVFELYYTGSSSRGLTPKTDAVLIPVEVPYRLEPMPHTVDKRWLIFSIHFGFAKYKGVNTFQWVPESSNWDTFLTQSTRESNNINAKSLDERLRLFADFWYNTLLLYGDGSYWRLNWVQEILRWEAIAEYMLQGRDPFNNYILLRKLSFSPNSNARIHLDYVLESKFLPWVKIKLTTSISNIKLKY